MRKISPLISRNSRNLRNSPYGVLLYSLTTKCTLKLRSILQYLSYTLSLFNLIKLKCYWVSDNEPVNLKPNTPYGKGFTKKNRDSELSNLLYS